MKSVYLSYNPYLVKSVLKINGQDVADSSSPFYRYLDGARLQFWMEPRKSDGWKGLLGELRSACGSDEIELTFHGTELDFQDIDGLVRQEGPKHFKKITLLHENKDTAEKSSPEAKLEGLKEIYTDIKKGPVPEFHTEEIEKAFNNAMNSDFEIVVIAPMSSGKSTLINAILGGDVLPAINQATTAVITRIRDVDGKKGFTVSAVDRHGKELCKKGGEPATLKRLTELNGAIDPEDPEKKRALAKVISIEGDIKTLPAKGLHTVFVDTPGGNNSLNEEHGAVMDEAIYDEDKSMVLYVFNGTQVSTNDNAAILKKIADAMKRSTNGKQSRDRFLFVANRMDDVETEKESYEDMVATIKTSLAEVGITEPNLFLVSAQTAKLLRMRAAKAPFTESEDDQYDALCKKMTRESRQLYEYSSLTESQKGAFRVREKQLREENPEMTRIPEIAEINSGVPAVELAMTEYLQKYALAIKLKKAQDAFGDVVKEMDIRGRAQKRWAESKEAFEKVQEEVKQLADKQEKDQTLAKTFTAIDEISFDASPYRKEMAAFIQKFQDLSREYADGHSQVSPGEAAQLKNQLESEVVKIQASFMNVTDALTKDLMKQCDRAMEEYKRNIETLRQNGLFDIGGVRVDQFAAFKKVDRSTKVDMEDYHRVREVSYTVRVKDSGFFSIFKRFLGIGGYHDETRYRTEKYVNFSSFARDSLGQLESSITNDMKELIKKAEDLVNEKKNKAKEQAQEVENIIRSTIKEYKEKTKSREKLEEANKQGLIAFEFAKEIIEKVDGILEV